MGSEGCPNQNVPLLAVTLRDSVASKDQHADCGVCQSCLEGIPGGSLPMLWTPTQTELLCSY